VASAASQCESALRSRQCLNLSSVCTIFLPLQTRTDDVEPCGESCLMRLLEFFFCFCSYRTVRTVWRTAEYDTVLYSSTVPYALGGRHTCVIFATTPLADPRPLWGRHPPHSYSAVHSILRTPAHWHWQAASSAQPELTSQLLSCPRCQQPQNCNAVAVVTGLRHISSLSTRFLRSSEQSCLALLYRNCRLTATALALAVRRRQNCQTETELAVPSHLSCPSLYVGFRRPFL
jgi:hypothetical protein